MSLYTKAEYEQDMAAIGLARRAVRKQFIESERYRHAARYLKQTFDGEITRLAAAMLLERFAGNLDGFWLKAREDKLDALEQECEKKLNTTRFLLSQRDRQAESDRVSKGAVMLVDIERKKKQRAYMHKEAKRLERKGL